MIKDILGVKQDFSALSTKDLLDARDQYHWHLIHKKNVVGTAIGLYFIRKADPLPQDRHDREPKPRLPRPRGKRTFENSEVRSYSWPCVLVLVNQWYEPEEFAAHGMDYEDLVPKALYLPDGRVVPVCVVCVEPEEPDQTLLPDWNWPAHTIGGGFPLISRAQGLEHVASVGCLVTDGHQIYALTNRHVAGPKGHPVETTLGGRTVEIGRSSAQQLTRLPFNEVYPEFVARRTFLTLDAGLIDVTNAEDWTSQVYGIGEVGAVADLSEHNITTRLVNAQVVAYGAASGLLRGRIAALFFRHHSLGGYDDVTDFMIVPLPGTSNSQPGDSGTVWHLLLDDPGEKPRPLALQWGGQGFQGAGSGRTFNVALAASLSNVLRLLSVELVSEHHTGAQPFWGKTGHYSIGTLACKEVSSPDLKALLKANTDRISFPEGDLEKPDDIDSATKKAKKDRTFVPLADVPDVIWKNVPYKKVNGKVTGVHGGRDTALNRGPEHPTHFADIDEKNAHSETLLHASVSNPANVNVAFWRAFYDGLGHTSDDDQGLLPFRVWQFFDAMVKALKDGHIERYVCAAGLMAHYVGDACQPLHASALFNGFTDGRGSGVHTAFETTMIDNHAPQLLPKLRAALSTPAPLPHVANGQGAAVALVRLMDRTATTIPPVKLIEAYIATGGGQSKKMSQALFDQFGDATAKVMADGIRTLGMIWESAWLAAGAEGKFTQKLGPVHRTTLRVLYENTTFVESFTLGEIGPHLV